jgi:putative ABC transport system permease protein
MRVADILGFALSALRQQKMRAVLTTLGVVFGTLVLAVSLSVGRGVQDTIRREWSRHWELRQIDVYSSYEAPKPDLSKEKLLNEGSMSEAKRERLRQDILRRANRGQALTEGTKMTPERLDQLRKMEHVVSVVPPLFRSAWVTFNHKTEEANTCAAAPDHKLLRDRLVAGDSLSRTSGHEAVVSEYLLYRLGIIDDANTILGKNLRLEFRAGEHRPNLLLSLFNAERPRVAVEEQQLLEKVIKQLPAALDKLDLTVQERSTLKKMLQPPASKSKAPELETVAAEFTIVGVIRGPAKEDPQILSDWWTSAVDVVLPVETAEELFFRVAAYRTAGLDHAIVQVDDFDHVKEVTEKINGLGLRASSMVELIEREQFTNKMIFGGMTCVAAVALLVAALGITNTLLMSVLERTREIGILKAVGARDRHILSIFLVEGALIGVTGSLIGLALSKIASIPGDAYVRSQVTERLKVEFQESLFVFPLWLVLGAPLFACAITTLAALYPARRAAKVNPIETLRHE